MKLSSRRILVLAVTAIFMGVAVAPVASADTSNIMHVYVMNNQGQIAGTIAVPQGSEDPPKVSFSGFQNSTVVRGSETLTISRGNGEIVALFRDGSQGGVTTISTSLKQQDGGQWIAVIQADYTPTGRPDQIGDAFLLNYTSSLQGQYEGLQNGMTIVSHTYSNARDQDIKTLGGYYLILAQEVSQMIGLMASQPNSILHITVSGSVGLATDDLVCEVVTETTFFVVCALASSLCGPFAFACGFICTVYASVATYYVCTDAS